jgi:hypothetical protein
LVHNFHFDLSLPAPAPHPKTIHVPLDSERFIKPKLGVLGAKRKASLFCDLDMLIPPEEIAVSPDKFNPL